MLSPIFIVMPKRMNCKLMMNNDNEYVKKTLEETRLDSQEISVPNSFLSQLSYLYK